MDTKIVKLFIVPKSKCPNPFHPIAFCHNLVPLWQHMDIITTETPIFLTSA